MVRAFGMLGERVEKAKILLVQSSALANRPALLDVVVTTEAGYSDAKTGLARAPDVQPLAAWDGWRADI